MATVYLALSRVDIAGHTTRRQDGRSSHESAPNWSHSSNGVGFGHSI
jgi:hypothetical protein